MRKTICKRFVALFLALCLLCGSAGFAEAVKADKETIRQVQEALNEAGFDCGTPDGISGKKTRSAIQEYQEANGLTASGEITEDLLADMGIPLPEADEPDDMDDMDDMDEDSPEAGSTPKPLKGGSGLRTVSIPQTSGGGQLSDFNFQDLLDNIEESFGLSLRVVGTVDDVSGMMSSDTQEELQELWMSTPDGQFLVDFSDSALQFPALQVGDTITVSGTVDGSWSVGEPGDPYYSEGLTLRADAIAPGEMLAPGAMSDVIIATAQLNGELLSVTRGAYSPYDADVEHGLVAMDDSYNGKGFGSPMLVLNYRTGMIFQGSEGAEVYLCDSGVLRFEWRDAETGEVVDPETVFNYYLTGEEYDPEENGEPRTFQLYALFYDFEGNLIEERLILDFREDEMYEYSKVEKPKEKVDTEFKAHTYGNRNYNSEKQYSNVEEIRFVDDGGDAVGYDSKGNFLIRLEDRDADALFGFLLKKQRILSVSFWDEYLTAFFLLDE